MGKQYDEVEVDIKDLFLFLIQRWKSLILVICLGAFLGIGVYLFRMPEQSEVSVEKVGEVSKEYEVTLSVENNMNLAHLYRQVYDKQVYYNEHSLIMQIDPNEVYTGKLRYYLSAGENTRLIGQKIVNVFNDTKLLEEMKTAGDVECDLQYLREVVSALIEDDGSVQIDIKDSDSEFEDTVVVYTICYKDEKSCEKMLQVLQKWIKNLLVEVQEQYDCDIQLINKSVQKMANQDYFNWQKNHTDIMNMYVSNINRLENSFVGDDLAYYKAKYFNQESTNGETTEDDISEANETKSESVFSGGLAKSIFIGIVLLILSWGMVWIVVYLLDKRIKTEREFVKRYQLPVFGRLIGKTIVISEEIEVIKALLRNRSEKNIAICGNMDDCICAEYMNSIALNCSKVKVLPCINKNNDIINNSDEIDGVVIVVYIGKTLYPEFERELEVCRLQNLPVLGVIEII